MAYADRVKETTTTTGTGALTLAGAATGFRTFTAGFTVGATMPYAVSDALGNWEIGTGTLSAGTTLARTTVLKSSNGDALVDFPAGSKDVFCTPNAAAFAAFASATDATTATIANVATSKILIEEGGVTKRISMADFLAALGTTAGGLPAAAALTGADIIAVSQDGGATQVKTTLAALASYLGTPAPTGTAPGAPTIGTVTGGDGSASVAFTPGTAGSTATTGYIVTPYIGTTAQATKTGTASPINVTGLTNGQAYTFKVAAINSVGTGAQSAASASVTPAAVAPSGPDYRTTVGPFNPPQAGNISSNGYYGTGSELFIKSPTNQTPANVYLAWSKSPTVAPTTTTNPQGNAYVLAGRVGSWTQGGSPSQSYYGLYGAPGTLYAYGTAGIYYLWIITDDGVAKPYDNNTGTPIGFNFT